MQGQERRQYFRIDQRVSLELKVISESDMEQHPRPTQFGVSPNFLLLSELQEIDTQSNHLLRKISEKDSNVASFLQIIHNKIERIAQAIASTEMSIEHSAIQEANLSEGGIQFKNKEPFDESSFLSVKLIFPESCLGLLIYSQCCRCEKMADGSYLIGLEFIKMPESCRMILARQIFESQARLRQQAPENIK